MNRLCALRFEAGLYGLPQHLGELHRDDARRAHHCQVSPAFCPEDQSGQRPRQTCECCEETPDEYTYRGPIYAT